MRTRYLTLALRTLLSVAATAPMLLSACSDSKEERLAVAKLAESCVLNSDCKAGLKCVFQHCHDVCKADGDCPEKERCVRASEPGVDSEPDLHVCQLPDELSCRRDKDCPGFQVCAVDLECRDPCMSSKDCLASQTCSTDDACASTVEGKDLLDEHGNLVFEGSGAGGEGNAPGSETGSAGASTAEVGGTRGSGEGGEGGEGGSVTPGYYETSDGVEAQPNDTREEALPLPESPSVWLNGPDDEDWFYVDTPDDGKAHLLTVRLVQEAGTATFCSLLSADFTQIGKYGPDTGTTNGTFYATLGPQAHVLLRLLSNNLKQGRVVVDWQLTDEADPYVHGDKAHATPIELDSEISAQLLNRYVSESNQGSADWYQLDLAAGSTTVRIVSAPGIHMNATLVDSNNVELKNTTSAVGVTGDLAFNLAKAGHYYLRLNSYNISAKETDTTVFATVSEPLYMSDQYVFKVLQ
jgi:hypothetical protein